MKNVDAAKHSTGRANYVDDELRPEGMLFAAIAGASIAHAGIRSMDTSAIEAHADVVAVVTSASIPGENQVGSIIPDEPLLADGTVRYIGQPLALVLARTATGARNAADLLSVTYDQLDVVVDPREAYAKGSIIGPTRQFEMGDTERSWQECTHIVEGTCEIGGQEHVYLETQRARAVPLEDARMRVQSSTQSPYAAQRHVARVLGIPDNNVEVDVLRLGGGFGGKEDQATHWACFAALGAWATGSPVEIVLRRDEDFRMTGKRHPYAADFKLGADANGKLLAYEATFFQNAGAAADLSTGVLERTLYHATNSYFIPNVRVFAASCRTNLPPNTAFRGFGGPQGVFVIESAISKLAQRMGVDSANIQRTNLLQNGDTLPYGQTLSDCRAVRTWDRAAEEFDFSETSRRIAAFNRSHVGIKKGYSAMPICFGISFTTTFLNQAGALVHVYTDGSVSVSTGGIDMGQGLATNMARITSLVLGIDASRVHVESTNTTRVANMSPSAASSTTMLNGNAVVSAVSQIKDRLFAFLRSDLDLPESAVLTIESERVVVDGTPTNDSWNDLVGRAYLARIDLSAHGFFATPDIHFDKTTEKGHPFAYHTYGTALTETTVDVIRGRYRIDSVRIVHDMGRPLNRVIDLGQVEGALAQGLGWMTMEDLQYDSSGRLLSGNLASYKVPDAHFMPDDIEVVFLEDADEFLGPYGSKAVGEPPLLYGIGAYFAIRNALMAFGPSEEPGFDSPMTPERVLMQLYPEQVIKMGAL